MKKIMLTLSAVLCCAMATTVITACHHDNEEDSQNLLVGTWTEKNDLYTDVLTLNEDETFSFQSHINLYSGSGYYKQEVIIPSNINTNPLTSDQFKWLLYLNYGGKQSQTLEIRKLNNSTLELTSRNGDIFRFSR